MNSELRPSEQSAAAVVRWVRWTHWFWTCLRTSMDHTGWRLPQAIMLCQIWPRKVLYMQQFVYTVYTNPVSYVCAESDISWHFSAWFNVLLFHCNKNTRFQWLPEAIFSSPLFYSYLLCYYNFLPSHLYTDVLTLVMSKALHHHYARRPKKKNDSMSRHPTVIA